MNQRTNFQKIFYILSIAFLLSACSSGGSNPPSALGGGGNPAGPTTQSISGIVSDPAIEHADVRLFKLDGSPADISGLSGSDGRFTLTGVASGSLSGFRLITKDGADTGTGQSFEAISLCLPLALYQDYSSVVVSPITCLVDAAFDGSDIDAAIAKVKARLGDIDPKTNPAGDAVLQPLAMKITLIAAEGKTFAEIFSGLDITEGIDDFDLANIFNREVDAVAKDRVLSFFALIDAAVTSGENLSETFQKALIDRTIRESVQDALAGLKDATEIANVNANIKKLVNHLMALKATASRPYLMKIDILATISGGGGLINRGKFLPVFKGASAGFDPTGFNLVMIQRSGTFSDSLKVGYYTVGNPITGNKQLVAYDAVTQKQTVVRDNVIFGDRAFVLEGVQDGDALTYTGKKFGVFLDPNQSREKRTAKDSRGRSFEYEFFFDNAFKRFDVATPSSEALIFDSSMLSQALKDQGIQRLSGEYTLHNNVSDADHSYVGLKALQRLPDLLLNETGDNIFQTPIVVALLDGKMIEGKVVHILKNSAGETDRVLIGFVDVHKPADGIHSEKLQLCTADLSDCTDVVGGEGEFSTLTESDTDLYLGRKGDAAIYAFNKLARTFGTVSGVSLPGPFDRDIHILNISFFFDSNSVIGRSTVLTDANHTLSDGPNAYLSIHYDLDTQNPLGQLTGRRGKSPIFLHKHARIYKLTGSEGRLLFDNGDGVDDGDLSDGEATVGHLHLIAVSNGRLFVETGNYDGVPLLGTCIPDETGHGCSSLRYGYLNLDNASAPTKNVLDVVLHEKSGLSQIDLRRVQALAANGKLYLSVMDQESTATSLRTFAFLVFDLGTLEKETVPGGRTLMVKRVEHPNGVQEGTILVFNIETNQLINVTDNIVLGKLQEIVPFEPPMVAMFARPHGGTFAGFGELYLLSAHNGGGSGARRGFRLAGITGEAGGLHYIDLVPGSSWLYE